MSHTALAPPRVTRHFLLDLSRFLAAAAVIVWHYQHFFYVTPGTLVDGYTPASSPFFGPLKAAYYYGDLGVQFFFVLSGFIFFWLYWDQVAERTISAYSFAVRRFSRLYPLHFVTLVFVAVFQAVAMLSLSSFIVYPENDLKHFILNLFLASQWGFEDGLSFNTPVWSVSVEVLLYIAFFYLSRLARSPWVTVVLGWALGSIVIILLGDPIIGWALIGFFCGGLVANIYRVVTDESMSRVWRRCLLAVLPLVLAALAWLMLRLPGEAGNELLLHAGLFPALILWISLVQATVPTLGRRSAWLGDISYGIYLLHFPIQLVILLADRALDLGIDYTSDVFFISYFVTTIGLAYALFVQFEKPARDWLRYTLETRAMRSA